MRRLAWLLAVAACLWAGAALAAESSEEGQAAREAAPESSSSEGDNASDTDSKAPAASASEHKGQERLRQLSEAFKDFKPSEAISADNAVPFPADI